jgi:hypothetical protein
VPQKPAPLSAFSVEQNPPYFSLCSAASDAVTHFLGVSSLNSGRSQGRPFFIIRPPEPRCFFGLRQAAARRCRQLCTLSPPISLRDVSEMLGPRSAISEAIDDVSGIGPYATGPTCCRYLPLPCSACLAGYNVAKYSIRSR